MPPRSDNPATCAACGLRRQCLPGHLSATGVAVLDAALRRHRYGKGEDMYKQGGAFRRLFIVRGGAFRQVSHTPDGEQHVLGFSLPGDMIGFDGASTGHYTCSAEALEEGRSCALAVSDLTALLEREPGLRPRVLSMIGAELARAHAHAFLLTQASPLSRVAAFVDDLAHRYGTIERSARALLLPMSRRDIASFTGLAFETVSRALSKLHADGVLKVDSRHLEILDRKRLRKAYTPFRP